MLLWVVGAAIGILIAFVLIFKIYKNWKKRYDWIFSKM